MTHFLASYKPLIMNKRGRSAADRYGFPPYVDHSCRREPDFESDFPSITAICRGTRFAPRLNVADVVVYMTVQGTYPGRVGRHRRLTAVLRVIERFDSHRQASEWYEAKGLEIPGNCMVRGNDPLMLDQTSNPMNYDRVTRWDAFYRRRVSRTPVFLACEPVFRELHSPPVLTEDGLREVFGKIPVTRTPPAIATSQYRHLQRRLAFDKRVQGAEAIIVGRT